MTTKPETKFSVFGFGKRPLVPCYLGEGYGWEAASAIARQWQGSYAGYVEARVCIVGDGEHDALLNLVPEGNAACS